MDQEKQLIRAVFISHVEPYLMAKGSDHQYQLIVRIQEAKKTGIYTVSVSLFNLTTVLNKEKTCDFGTRQEALDWMYKVFSEFEYEQIAVLYLPEWKKQKYVDEVFKKWADGLFGLEGEKLVDEIV